jgi:hypothetical protein
MVCGSQVRFQSTKSTSSIHPPVSHIMSFNFTPTRVPRHSTLPATRLLRCRLRATPCCRPRAISVVGCARFTLPSITCGSPRCQLRAVPRAARRTQLLPAGRMQLLPSPDMCIFSGPLPVLAPRSPAPRPQIDTATAPGSRAPILRGNPTTLHPPVAAGFVRLLGSMPSASTFLPL